MSQVFWSDTAKTWEVFAALHNSLKHVQYICILDDIGCTCEKWRKLYLCVHVLRNVCIHYVSQLSNAHRKFMTSTFTLPLHCLTCPYQTLQIQWPEPVLLPLAWSGHFQVQVPLLLHHSQPLPKVLLLFPANERHFFLHSTTQWLSLTWKRIITYLLPAISCGVLHTWTCTQRWRIAESR